MQSKVRYWPKKHVAIHSTLVETNKKKILILLKKELYRHHSSYFLHIKNSIFGARGHRSVIGPSPWNGQGPGINL